MCKGQNEITMDPKKLLTFPQKEGRVWADGKRHPALSNTMALKSGTLARIPTLSLPRCMTTRCYLHVEPPFLLLVRRC